MIDIIYKLIRKRLPKNLYRLIQDSPFGRAKKRETIDTYEGIFKLYQSSFNTSLENKTVIEVGCGVQFFTSLFFILNGVKKIILIDPKLNLSDCELLFVDYINHFNYKCSSWTAPHKLHRSERCN